MSGMYEVDPELIAAAVIEKLRSEHWVAGSFPAAVGQWIRDSTGGYARQMSNMIYMDGVNAITERWIVAPTGALSLELLDLNGAPFWRGTFEPVSS